MTGTCQTCELHAESTFTVEGMDCREEVAMIERRFKNLRGVEASEGRAIIVSGCDSSRRKCFAYAWNCR